MLWVADITYLRTWEGWVYLAAVQDAYSRRIVGWAMAEHMRAELVVDALQMALHRRRPEPGLIHHSDQGAQFVCLAFGQKARDAGIAVSMGSKGCAYDNAVAESFFATLKKELVHRRSWPTRRELISEVFEFVEGFYNTTRRHSTLGYLSPAQFETMTTIKINKENGYRRKPEVSEQPGPLQTPAKIDSYRRPVAPTGAANAIGANAYLLVIDDSPEVELSLYPADTLGQAKAFYPRHNAQAAYASCAR